MQWQSRSSLLASPAAAQGFKCDHAPAIVSLTSTILTKRADLARLQQRNAPAPLAAYLAIQYTPLGDHEAETLLADLIADDARGVDEVAFAWSYGMDGGDVTSRMLGADAVQRMVSIASVSAIRAMIREGDEETLLATIAELDSGDKYAAYQATAIALLDYSNDVRRQIAGQALDRGLVELAALLVALDDKGRKEWDAFTRKLADPALVSQLTQLWRWAPAFVGGPELPRTPDQSPLADPAMRARSHDVFIAAAKTPQIDFLMTLLNQTGRVEETAAAADALTAAIATGEIARDGSYGPAWLLEYRVLRQKWDDDDYLLSTLKSFEYPTPRGSRRPLEMLDTLIAIEALTPYLKGETDGLPEKPGELSADFTAWPQWIEIAAKVKADPADPSLSDEAVVPIAADLLLAAGEIDALATVVAAAPGTATVLRLAADMAVQLDRMCAGYLYHPVRGHQPRRPAALQVRRLAAATRRRTPAPRHWR